MRNKEVAITGSQRKNTLANQKPEEKDEMVQHRAEPCVDLRTCEVELLLSITLEYKVNKTQQAGTFRVAVQLSGHMQKSWWKGSN